MAESAPLPQPLARRGLMFILSSPSGAGKTTIARKLLEQVDGIGMSVSVTTRPIRPGEVDGKDYIFTDQPGFDRMKEEGEFLEWARVFGNSYGTPKAQIKAGLKEGHDFLFDIDWQGTQQLYQRMETDVVRVFLLPPSLTELEHRLRSRGTDSAEVIQGRMDRAKAEISHWDGYDYVVVNDVLERCVGELAGIVMAERARLARRRHVIQPIIESFERGSHD
jgi:guanylate kinase